LVIKLFVLIRAIRVSIQPSQFGDGDGLGGADGDAALAVAAIIAGADDGFVVFPLEDFDRANVCAFAAVGAFIVV
jgi:hypothetical protein